MTPIGDSTGIPRSAFLILLALADQARHGLGIVEEVESRTKGAVRLGPGTLYTMLRRLAEAGHIVEVARAPDPSDDDPRRRYYRVTASGRSVLRAEAEHMKRLVQIASSKRVLEGGT